MQKTLSIVPCDIVTSAANADDLACRRQQLHEHDLVNQLQLSSFAKSKMQQCAQIHGQSFGHSMQGLDSIISQQLQRMIS